MKKVKDDKKAAKKERFAHDYDCTRCGKTFKLPVELDRNRPIYCEDCHPIVMEERKSGKKGDSGKRQETGGKRVLETPPKVGDGVLVIKESKNEESEKDISLDRLMGEEGVLSGKRQETRDRDLETTDEGQASNIQHPTSNIPRAGDMVVATKMDLDLKEMIDKDQLTGDKDQTSTDEIKKKRKRRRKKKTSDERLSSVTGDPMGSPLPQSQSINPQIPKSVMPNERITFDE